MSVRCRVHSEDLWSWWWHGEWSRPWWWRWRNWGILQSSAKQLPGLYLQHAAFLPSSVDLRSLNRNGKLRHVFLSIGNSLQTAELNTALHSPSYTPGHGPIFHLYSWYLDEPWWPDAEGETGSVVDSRQEWRVVDLWRRTCNKLKKLINCLQILNLGLGVGTGL